MTVTNELIDSLLLVVHPSLPVKTMPEFLAYARAKGADLFYGSAGNGSTQNLVGELFNSMAGTKMKHVPFKGNRSATASLLAGDIQVFFDIVPTALSMGQSGKIRTLALAGPNRNQGLPGIPTICESGVPGYESAYWLAVFLPRGTPAPVVQQWLATLKNGLEASDVRKRMEEAGLEIVASGPEQLQQRLRTDLNRYAKVIAQAGIRAD